MNNKSGHRNINVQILVHARRNFPKELTLCMQKSALSTLSALLKKDLKKLSQSKPYTLGISIISSTKSQEFNTRYRGKRRPTDVLAFSRLEGMQIPSPQPDIGDVLICLAVARRQSREYKTTIKQELSRLTVHGVLHLFGYDHEKSKKEATRMFLLQEAILATLE